MPVTPPAPDLAELERVADAVGETVLGTKWDREETHVRSGIFIVAECSCCEDGENEDDFINAQFITTFDPHTVKWLLGRVRELEEDGIRAQDAGMALMKDLEHCQDDKRQSQRRFNHCVKFEGFCEDMGKALGRPENEDHLYRRKELLEDVIKLRARVDEETCDICQGRTWVWMALPGGFTQKMPCQRCKPDREELWLLDKGQST